MNKSLQLLLRLAKIREDQALALARQAGAKKNETLRFKDQVIEYAKDYEKSILDGAQKGMSISFIQDANSFREKLLLSSVQIEAQMEGLNQAADRTMQGLAKARMRAKGLTKLMDKSREEARRKKERSEQSQFEDNYVAKMILDSGMKDA